MTHEAISLFVRSCEGELSGKTIKGFRSTLYRLPDVPLDTITDDTLREWRSQLRDSRGRTISADSANTYMKRVQSFLNYCEQKRWIVGNPARLVRPLRVVPKQRLYLERGQVAALLDVSSIERDRGALAVSIHLLLRAGSIAMLRVGDYDARNRRLSVLIEKKKGVFARDLLVVTDELAGELGKWLDNYREAVGPLRPEYFLFPSTAWRLHGAHRVISYTPAAPMAHPERLVARALQAIGVVTERQGYHDLRRSMARLRYDDLVQSEGKDDALAVVSSLLGHASRRTTELYLGTDGDRTRRDAVMQTPAWRRVSGVTSTSDEAAPPGLAKVLPMTR